MEKRASGNGGTALPGTSLSGQKENQAMPEELNTVCNTAKNIFRGTMTNVIMKRMSFCAARRYVQQTVTLTQDFNTSTINVVFVLN